MITMAPAANSRAPLPPSSAFTLVELLVTMTIISIVAGLALSGLAGARQRAKIDKTKSTIRKLHEIVLPQYESYLSRRVSGTDAASRLAAVRLLMVQEMPDQWLDVYPSGNLTLPSNATAPTRRYAAYKASLASAIGTQWAANSTTYEGAECVDNDGAPEFWDGWGRPIGFFRWAAGFSSTMQSQNATLSPDPFDPLHASIPLNYPSGTTQTDYALVPLIYSSGPGGATDDPLTTASGYKIDASFHWLQNTPIRSTRAGSPVAGEINDTAVATDNITNHDLISK